MGDRCGEFDTRVSIQGPWQLKRILAKLRQAVVMGALTYNSFESDRALIGQVSFSKLDLEGPLSDVLRYYFTCKECGNLLGLIVETYPGQG